MRRYCPLISLIQSRVSPNQNNLQCFAQRLLFVPTLLPLVIVLCFSLSLSSLSLSSAHAHNWKTQKVVLFVNYMMEAKALKATITIPGPLCNDVMHSPIQFNYPLKTDLQMRLLNEFREWSKIQNPVLIDNIRVYPTLDELIFILTAPDEEVNTPDLKVEGVSVHSGQQGACVLNLSYPLTGTPQIIKLQWDSTQLYMRDSRKRKKYQLSSKLMPGLFVFEDDLTPLRFSPEDPEVIWRRPTPKVSKPKIDISRLQGAPLPPPRLPILAFVTLCLGIVLGWRWREHPKRVLLSSIIALLTFGLLWSARPLAISNPWSLTTLSDEDAQQRFTTLHENIYRAFAYERDEEIYDALAQSVDGQLLDWIFQRLNQSLILREEGGAKATVIAVKSLSWSRLPWDGSQVDQGFVTRYRWRVIGEVKHWGHSHRRVNEYEAIYHVLHTPTGWRIVKIRPIGHTRRPELEGTGLE